MPTDPKPPVHYGLPPLNDPGAWLKLAAIAVLVVAIALCFAYTAGWLTPHNLSPLRFINAFQHANGVHPGFRRNHAKGVCVTGTFASNGQAQRLSKAVVFQSGSTPVIGRFAIAGGQPDAADGPQAVRSMALSFRPSDGEEWRTGMNDIPVFPFATPQDFYDQLRAARPDPATGKPDPAKLKAFMADHPKTAAALQVIGAKPFSSGFANATYNGLDAFRFVNDAGTAMPVRWSMVASEPFAPETPDQSATPDKNYLFDGLISRLKQGPLQWHLVITIGQPGDPTNDATIPWPEDREKVDAGTLTIDHIESEAPGNCRDINYDPLVLPAGIEPSDDPLLSARSAVYAQSFKRRAGETAQPSAVQVNDSGKAP